VGRIGFIVLTLAIAAASFAIYETLLRTSIRLTTNDALSFTCAIAFIVVPLAAVGLLG
jgi:hypothetical protein